METTPTRAVEDCLIEMFQSLGIAQAHIAAGQLVPGDWLGLAARYPERVASLILVSPRPRSELNGLESRLLVIAGGFRAVISLFTAIARVRRRTGWLLAAYGGLAVILLPLAVVLARPMGLDGVALAWLIAHATVAVAVLVPMLRLLRTPGDAPQAWSSQPVPLLAATAVAAGDR